jgi:ATP-dependent Clp protease ATP-binding subunit ClpB
LPDKAIDVIDEVGAMQMLVAPSKRKKTITAKEIEAVIATMARIPPKSVSSDDKATLASLETDLKRVVFGQNTAIEVLSSAIKLSRAGLRDPEKPIGNYLFSGPTGVGKTEVAKQLASIMGIPLQRFDMSEYMERHSVSRLIGAPPGYVGYEEGGYLTEAVRRKPYSVVLLDEVEKAHPDVFNVLLQVLDDGRLTDGQGRTVDFKNTVIVMTSNLGSQLIQSMTGEGEPFDVIKGAVWQEVKTHFRPEFLNRIDEVVVFHSLDQSNIESIARIQLKRLAARLAHMDLTLEITDNAVAKLASAGYDPVFGARPLKRAIQQQIENPVARMILEGKYSPKDVVPVDYHDGQFTFERVVH